jgi:hypothetical protein
MSRRICSLTLLILIVLSSSVTASAQSVTDGSTPGALTPGSPEGSFRLSGLDTVNPYNGNLHFEIPLLNIGGRGSNPYTVGVYI